MTTWWEDHNSRGVDPLSSAATELLDAVESAHLAQDPPSWPAPENDPRDEDYSACADPGKFRMIVDRCRAWAQILEERGWADVTRERMVAEDWRITLLPRRAGALRLRLQGAAWIFDNGRAPLVEVRVGEHHVGVGDHPDCACDGCDRGSADVADSLDRDIFSVVDGSFRVTGRNGERWVETSFGGMGAPTSSAVREIHGEPWAPDWRARPIPTPTPVTWPDPWPEDWPADGRFRRLPEQ